MNGLVPTNYTRMMAEAYEVGARLVGTKTFFNVTAPTTVHEHTSPVSPSAFSGESE